jgi:Predicted alternative thymidylate synthase
MVSVQYDAHMGSDLSVVNAARASFGKETREMRERDRRLIRYLAGHSTGQVHESPFRHAFVRFKVRSTLGERILWETGPKNHIETAQYRAGMVFMPTLTELLETHRELGDEVEWRWTASVQAIARFLNLWKADRLTGYVWPILEEVQPRFPETISALTGFESQSSAFEPKLRETPDPIPVLDQGYVRLVDWMEGPTEPETVVTFEIKAPQMVRAQWFKYRVESEHLEPFVIDFGSGNGDDGGYDDWAYARNEMSGRYTPPLGFYIPQSNRWRQAPENKKQGSGGPLDEWTGSILSSQLKAFCQMGLSYYDEATKLRDVAPEQARLFLWTAGAYTVWRWTASMTAVKHFLRQRLAFDAQHEITQYARAVRDLLVPLFPQYLEEVKTC